MAAGTQSGAIRIFFCQRRSSGGQNGVCGQTKTTNMSNGVHTCLKGESHPPFGGQAWTPFFGMLAAMRFVPDGTGDPSGGKPSLPFQGGRKSARQMGKIPMGDTSVSPQKGGNRPDGRIVATVENSENGYFIGVPFHPGLKSRPNRPHPLFCG